MNIRVIAGLYGGRTLVCPPGDRTHPMGERIRNAIFNSLGSSVQGVTVLDAFAGTGSVGIEALSRGASSATFIESDRIAQKVLRENITSLRIDNAQVIATTVSNWLETSSGEYDIIFADPPYHDTQGTTVARLAARLAPDGVFVLSWPAQKDAPIIDGLTCLSEKIYADAKIAMYRITPVEIAE